MHTGTHMRRQVSLIMGVLGLSVLLPLANTWSVETPQQPQADRREAISLTEAALRALQHNLDITVSRQTKESRLTDIIVEQAKFDPLLSLNGQYNRSVSPLNRPILGFGGNVAGVGDEPATFDQNSSQVTVDVTQNLLTGANYDLNFSPSRTFVGGNPQFLFNPGYQSGLAFTLTQPLLRNFGPEVNRTFIRIAQNTAKVEEQVFLDHVLTVIATVEQTFWELVFANENLKVAQAALKAAEELLASNRAKAKAGVMAIVEVLQAEAAVASRVEQVLVAEKAIRDQEDQLKKQIADIKFSANEQGIRAPHFVFYVRDLLVERYGEKF
ncbi:MAG: TolC family protein, partial [Nitrospirota bacterium]